jgi:hypothetical protein
MLTASEPYLRRCAVGTFLLLLFLAFVWGVLNDQSEWHCHCRRSNSGCLVVLASLLGFSLLGAVLFAFG